MTARYLLQHMLKPRLTHPILCADSEDKEVRVWDIAAAAAAPRLVVALPATGNARAVVSLLGGAVVCAAAGRELLVWR